MHSKPPTVAVVYLQSYPRTNPPTQLLTHTHTTVNVARRLPTARFCRLIIASRRRHLDMADPSAGGAPSHLRPLCSLQRALHSSARKTGQVREGERRRRRGSIVTVLHGFQWDSSCGLRRLSHLHCAAEAKLVREDDCGNFDSVICIYKQHPLPPLLRHPCERP